MVASLAVLMTTLASHAIPIQGSIQFLGQATTDPSGSAFIGYSGPGGIGLGPIVQIGTGDYAGIAAGAVATWSGFSFNPPVASVTPLWTFLISGITYSFDSDSMVVSHPDAFTWNISGTGIAHITGFDDTVGTWEVTATGSGTTFTFGASTSAVPDGGTTVLLLGAALSGLALVRRRLA